ncbi:MAG: hypothetical protein D3926_11330, partial [Desulfobacteraceae bacterium]
MVNSFKRLMMILFIGYMAVSLSGCLFCSMSGKIFRSSISYDDPLPSSQDQEPEPPSYPYPIGLIILAITGQIAVGSMLGLDGLFPVNYQDVCSAEFAREFISQVGLLGVFIYALIDPVVIQVPNDVTNLTATYDGGAGKQGSLIVAEGLQSVPITPTQSLVPEPGHHLVLMSFPDLPGLIPGAGADKQWYGINIQAEAESLRDIDIKVICTGKVEKDGTTYYVPLMPAVTDFAQVPAVTIPSSTAMQEITIPTPAQMPDTPGTVTYDFNYKLFYPHIAANTNWETETCVINTSSTQTLTGTLKAYNNSGTLVDSKAVTLAPHARSSYTVGTDFTTPQNIGYMILESDSPDMVGYMKFYVDTRYRGAIPAASQINSGEVYVSHIASNTNWWTGISLLNTTDASKTLTITFDNGQTRDVTLAANEHKVLSIKSLFGGTPQPGIKSAVITNTSGIVGLELFGSNAASANSYLSGVLLRDVTAT